MPCFDIQPQDLSGTRFFDKFKHPDYQLFSAFRLLKPYSLDAVAATSKPTKGTRKHRGCYRKYTVAEKEEAVKQVIHFLPRFWKEWTPRKSQKSMAFLAGTYSDGRKVVVSARKVVAGPLMARWRSLFMSKSTKKFSSLRKTSEMKRKNLVKWRTLRHQKDGIASLVGGIIIGNVKKEKKW